MSEVLSPSYAVNGKRLHTSQYFSFGGQVSTFVADCACLGLATRSGARAFAPRGCL